MKHYIETLLNMLKSRNVKIKYKDHTFLEHKFMYDDVSLNIQSFFVNLRVT